MKQLKRTRTYRMNVVDEPRVDPACYRKASGYTADSYAAILDDVQEDEHGLNWYFRMNVKLFVGSIIKSPPFDQHAWALTPTDWKTNSPLAHFLNIGMDIDRLGPWFESGEGLQWLIGKAVWVDIDWRPMPVEPDPNHWLAAILPTTFKERLAVTSVSPRWDDYLETIKKYDMMDLYFDDREHITLEKAVATWEASQAKETPRVYTISFDSDDDDVEVVRRKVRG